MLAAADHEHQMTPNHLVEGAPTIGGGHTSFYVLTCPCGRMELFPYHNFALTTPTYQATFTARVRAENCFLVYGVDE